MVISYNKLWKLLIDRKMNRQDLRFKAGISTASIAKLGKGENITTDILLKICEAMDCDITDIMEIDKNSAEGKLNG
jgi:DNA-binding Xre family transcriptional regulator